MDRSQQLARYLASHADEILGELPLPLSRVGQRIVREGVVSSVAEAISVLRKLAVKMPAVICIEHEDGVGDFLIFFHAKPLAEWISAKDGVPPDRPADAPSVDGEPSVVVRLAEELQRPTTGGSDLISKLYHAIVAVSAVERQRLLEAKAIATAPYTEICPSHSLQDCISRGNHQCREKIHFERVITSHTDPSLGDCSYLDTCFKGRACKFIHYRIMYPRKALDRAPAEKEQSLNVDILKLDLKLLGSNWAALIIDPPWDIHTNGSGSAGPAGPAGTNESGNQGIVSDADVLKLDIGSLQTEGVIFLWVTGRVLDTGRQCLSTWGYTHVEELVWCKTNQLARTICTGRTGHWLNHTKEHVLVGVKGKATWLRRQVDVDVLVSTARGRSHKPEELYPIIDRLVGPHAKKLELFGRPENLRSGWLTVGNELGRTRILDPELRGRLVRA